jgi:hypothetical protein
LKRKWLISILAGVSAAWLPLAASAQIAPDRGTRPERNEPTYKYEVFAGFGYTSLNQVNQSRYGLEGVEISATRDFGRYFGLQADGGFYPTSFGSGNPGKPSVSMVLGGPVLHANLYGPVNGYFHVLLGGEHTGGEGMTPSVSFAGGLGGGLEYQWSPRIVIRAGGDDIASSFSVINNSPQLGYSPHKRWNSRATIGVAYRF